MQQASLNLASTAVPAATGVGSVHGRERLDTVGKTVGDVYKALSKMLYRNELEPEWLAPANTLDDADEATSGARLARLWPDDSVWNRLAVSVDIGRSEGWIVNVDWIYRTETAESHRRGYAVMPMLRAKVFASSHAWDLARFIAYALNVA
ncbi:hypothetical protein [Paraburkholderia domus]|uniref:hypothetical protein n=1 Tax=Paraburkholderia domus TaxID=2793075 RepID=UPI001911E8DE|nr:hypothetical protein [Paraburkholderia domus]MBK5066018.1 hypothetical protein [Burkholderia sp. R-70199]CAE6966258.1 hypothetical protein R70199_07727 [Paraburkholderia domus]